MTAVLGAPGSGKSTLLQHFNGLLLPDSGNVRVGEITLDAGSSQAACRAVRRRVGLVFQYPEQQLFEETVLQDLCFGPLNHGVDEAEAEAAARRAAQWMGLDDSLLARSPFRLSSGQQRRAAIAAVLACDPDIIVLDEPTASLDAAGRCELMARLDAMCREAGKTVLVATHRLEDVAPYAEDYVVLREGQLTFHGAGHTLLQHTAALEAAGVIVPGAIRLALGVAELTGIEFDRIWPQPSELAAAIHQAYERGRPT